MEKLWGIPFHHASRALWKLSCDTNEAVLNQIVLPLSLFVVVAFVVVVVVVYYKWPPMKLVRDWGGAQVDLIFL